MEFVFPITPGAKTPVTTRGFHDASADPAVRAAWAAEFPDANWAIATGASGLLVVDIDGPIGEAAWLDLQVQHGFHPPTKEVSTPRGGRHIYFAGSAPSSASKLGPKIDVRSEGGYVLLPGSSVGGRPYTLTSDAPVSPAPEWLVTAAGRKREATKAESSTELDVPANVMRSITYLEAAAPAIEGEGGDDHTFRIVAELLDIGVSETKALELLEEHWNPRCVPPWETEDLVIKIERALKYKQNEAGAWAAGSSADTFGHLLGTAEAEPEEPAVSRFRPMTLGELAAQPPPTWLIPERLPAERVTMVYGQPGSYKSFVVLADALALARAGTPVVYVAGEGARELQLRAEAWMILNEVEGELPLYIVGEMPWASEGAQLTEFLAEVKPLKPALVIIDTVARAMVGLNENDAKDMGAFVSYADAIKRRLKAAVLVVHHSGKDDQRGPRGSAALMGAVDAALEVKADKPSKTVEVWVRRMKDAPERERPWTYRAQPFGQSIAFLSTTPAEHRMLTAPPESMTSGRMVGAALKRMGARGDEHGVTTRALASELLPPGENEAPEAREVAVGLMARALNARATTDLEVYTRGEGRSRVWCLPSGD